MRMPWKPKEEPCGGIVGVPTGKQEKLEKRLEKTEEELKKLHAATYGDKCEHHARLYMGYNGETNEFTFGYGFYSPATLLPPVSQEEAIELAEFIIDNYKGGNK